jgi:transposase
MYSEAGVKLLFLPLYLLDLNPTKKFFSELKSKELY